MGCGLNKRSQEEQFIADFYNSLPIREFYPDEIATALVDIKSNNNHFQAISIIQEKYFTSNLKEFSKVKLLSSYYLGREQSEMNIYISVLLLCKQNLLYHDKLCSGIFRIIEGFGLNLEEIFDSETKCNESVVRSVLEVYIELITSFSVELISDYSDNSEDFKKKLLPVYSNIEQVKFIKNHMKVMIDNRVYFKHFIYLSEEFNELLVRDRIMEVFKQKSDDERKEIERNELSKYKSNIDKKHGLKIKEKSQI